MIQLRRGATMGQHFRHLVEYCVPNGRALYYKYFPRKWQARY